MDITPLDRNGMAAWCARDIPEGWLVNLGIGIPTLVADFVPADREVIFHAENGVIGVGPAPAPDAVNPFLINASTTHVTLRTGAPTASPSHAAAIWTCACWARSRWPRTATSPTGQGRPTSR
jgi:3-oxoadipate CoA-transferase beta subunit